MTQQLTSKEKWWIAIILTEYCVKNKLTLIEEYIFHPGRKWRLDYFIEEKKVAIEYEGLFSTKSRHTNVTGYSKDTEKYNAAQLMGIKVLRYTAMTYKNLIKDLEKL